MVSSSAGKMIKRFSPLMDYLRNKGIPAGKVVTAKTLDEMSSMISSGEVAFMFESVYGALKIMDETGALPLLIREKDGDRMYNSVIFVRKDSPVQTFNDLLGKVIAFEDPTSTSSYMLPKNILLKSGLKLQESRKPLPGFIAYYFSKDDDNTIAQVKLGRGADAGGIENDPQFRYLTPESEYVPRHVLMIRKDVSYESLRNVLLSMKNDPEAAGVLENILTPGGFSEFDGNPYKIMNIKIRNALKIE